MELALATPLATPLVDPLCARSQLVIVSVHVDKGISTVTEWVQCGVDIYHMCQGYAVKQLAKRTVSSSSFRGSCVAVHKAGNSSPLTKFRLAGTLSALL